jgi:divalent metal cation (Fe/Co/Zn/Cd) transporter
MSHMQETGIQKVAVYSLLVNLGLVGTKLSLSMISGSLALRADAVHSLVDVFASMALILGLVLFYLNTPQLCCGDEYETDTG